MPTTPKYKYDIFLSYASEDRSWADKFYDDPENRGLVVFQDDKRLTPGLQ